jgi:short-subunit dehydrogenase involved in D-alanine esterification of teichoic acids
MNIPLTSSFRLDGERVLVAGGSSGIGFGFGCASVSALAKAGGHVVIGARNAVKLYEVASN